MQMGPGQHTQDILHERILIAGVMKDELSVLRSILSEQNFIIDKAISIFKKNKNYDLISNVFPRTFPKGQSVEIIRTRVLKKYLKNMNKFDKEHVTQYFYKNSEIFLIKNFINKRKNKLIKTAIDSKRDLVNILKNIKKNEFENYSIFKS